MTVRPHDKPWYTGFHRKLCRQKLRLYRQYKQLKTRECWNKFSEARSKYKQEINLAKANYENNRYSHLAEEGSRNSKKWWTLLKQVYSNNSIQAIPPIETDNSIITNDKDKADAFNTYFVEASSLEDTNATLPENVELFGNVQILENVDITDEDIDDQLQIMDVNKAYGPDCIPPRLLKEGGIPMRNILKRIFNISLNTGIFPSLWKKANVIPIHKKESATIVSNYRPVSLLCVTSKIFEIIIFKYFRL